MADRGLRHIALRARDLKATEKFYTEVLGLEVAFRHPPSMIFLRTPGTSDLLNFVRSAKRPSGNQGLEHIGFKIAPTTLKRLEKKLNGHGVAIDGRRGKSAVYISDPNGYRIEFYCD